LTVGGETMNNARDFKLEKKQEVRRFVEWLYDHRYYIGNYQQQGSNYSKEAAMQVLKEYQG